MRDVIKTLDPTDVSTVLSRVVNVLYLVAFFVTLVVAILRGQPVPALPPVEQTVTVQAPAPAALPSLPAAEAQPVGDPDVTTLTPGGTGTDAAMGPPEAD